jgi:hypothetical protein
VPIPEAPAHLHDLVVHIVPPENCPWSLSGPQFPVSNKAGALQQRYCYPKGRAEYSSYKGGALWTLRGADGKEDSEYRLLHVYQSQKRAANKGITLAPSTTPLSYEYTHYQPIPKKARYISPSRNKLLQTELNSNPFPGNIHRIDSCATLDTSLSLSTLDRGFSQSFESVQPNASHHSPHICRDMLSSQDPSEGRCSTLDNQHQSNEHLDHDFNFQDLHNDPLLQEMEQRTSETKFVQHLDIAHGQIRKYIFRQPQHLQPALVSTLAGWAKSLAMDPLWTRAKPGSDEFCHAFG